MAALSERGQYYIHCIYGLVEVRKKHGGIENVQEDVLLDQLDHVWAQLSEADRARVNTLIQASIDMQARNISADTG